MEQKEEKSFYHNKGNHSAVSYSSSLFVFIQSADKVFKISVNCLWRSLIFRDFLVVGTSSANQRALQINCNSSIGFGLIWYEATISRRENLDLNWKKFIIPSGDRTCKGNRAIWRKKFSQGFQCDTLRNLIDKASLPLLCLSQLGILLSLTGQHQFCPAGEM